MDCLHLSGSLRQAKVKIYPVFNSVLSPPDPADSSSFLLTLTESLINPKHRRLSSSVVFS